MEQLAMPTFNVLRGTARTFKISLFKIGIFTIDP